jgi:hypothetical protein
MNETHKSIFEKALQNLNHPLSSHLDETVRTAFKDFDMDARVFTAKLKKFGFDKDYRKMMQNFKKNANPGDGFFFIEEIPSDDERKRTKIGDSMKLEVLPVDGNYYNLKKLGDSDEQKRGGTVYKVRLIAIKENVQLDEGSEIVFSFDNPMKAGAFASRIMRDKLASEVDRYVSGRKEMVQVIMHPNDYERNDIEKLAKQYKGQLREDLQLDETNFRFPQPGEDYGELGMSINDPDSFSGSGPSRAELKKRSAEVDRKFASVMRKHKRTKVGEVLDLLDKDGGTKLYKDSDIKQISKYLTKHKDNVRKVAHQMMIDVMQGDDYLAKKRIPIREERVPTYVIDRQSKKIVHGPTDTGDAKLYLNKQVQPRKFMIRQIRGVEKKIGDTV